MPVCRELALLQQLFDVGYSDPGQPVSAATMLFTPKRATRMRSASLYDSRSSRASEHRLRTAGPALRLDMFEPAAGGKNGGCRRSRAGPRGSDELSAIHVGLSVMTRGLRKDGAGATIENDFQQVNSVRHITTRQSRRRDRASENRDILRRRCFAALRVGPLSVPFLPSTYAELLR